MPILRDFLLMLLLCSSGWLMGQGQLLKVTPFAEIDSLQAVAPRPLVLFIHTDWCRYCEQMQHTSLRDEGVVRLLNEKFYFLSLDAETEETIVFRQYPFSFESAGRNGGVHTLATTLGTVDDQLQYPTLVIMNTEDEIVFQYGAFLAGRELERVLNSLFK